MCYWKCFDLSNEIHRNRSLCALAIEERSCTNHTFSFCFWKLTTSAGIWMAYNFGNWKLNERFGSQLKFIIFGKIFTPIFDMSTTNTVTYIAVLYICILYIKYEFSNSIHLSVSIFVHEMSPLLGVGLIFCAQNVPTFECLLYFCAQNVPTFWCPLYFVYKMFPLFCVHFILCTKCH